MPSAHLFRSLPEITWVRMYCSVIACARAPSREEHPVGAEAAAEGTDSHGGKCSAVIRALCRNTREMRRDERREADTSSQALFSQVSHQDQLFTTPGTSAEPAPSGSTPGPALGLEAFARASLSRLRPLSARRSVRTGLTAPWQVLRPSLPQGGSAHV